MDFERLTLDEAVQVSKLVAVLGTPATIDELRSCCDVLEATLTLYRKELAKTMEAARNHAE
jgi:hypothetical protein